VASVADIEKDLRSLKPNVANAAKLGEVLGQRLKDKGVTSVVYDRNGYLYHGIVKAIADGVRKIGIQV
jgi:large subunit ribosomal protein L18